MIERIDAKLVIPGPEAVLLLTRRTALRTLSTT